MLKNPAWRSLLNSLERGRSPCSDVQQPGNIEHSDVADTAAAESEYARETHALVNTKPPDARPLRTVTDRYATQKILGTDPSADAGPQPRALVLAEVAGATGRAEVNRGNHDEWVANPPQALAVTTCCSSRSLKLEKGMQEEAGGGEAALWSVVRDCKIELATACLVFVATFMAFPGVTSHWLPLGNGWDRSMYQTGMVALFQVGDLLGRYAPSVSLMPSSRFVLGLSVSRALFIPLCIRAVTPPSDHEASVFPPPTPAQLAVASAAVLPLVARGAKQGSASLLASTPARVMIMFMFAVSNGYCASVACARAPEHAAQPQRKELVGFSISVALVGGIAIGSSIGAILEQALL
eukprot:GHVT01101713.1.p2 GENE.GHVT01101713.1~~GHVT01101713.1.p2  ORF type:complete len:352 (-),score=38.07 GHVT01101713.1:3381-4436(-)